jgi:hypothetical protein
MQNLDKTENYSPLAQVFDTIYCALEENGVTKADDVRFHYEYGRVKVTVNGEYYGIWDVQRKTFVD